MRVQEFSAGLGYGRQESPSQAGKEGFASLLILGRKLDGQAFRPSDWAERLASVACVFDEGGRSGLSALVRQEICETGGATAVRVSELLREMHPQAWSFMADFARDNGLSSRSEPWPGEAGASWGLERAGRGRAKGV